MARKKTTKSSMLHHWVAKENANEIRLLKVSNQELYQEDLDKKTPLFRALEKGNWDVLEALLEKGVDVNRFNYAIHPSCTPLLFTLKEPSLNKSSKWLVEHGADLEAPTLTGLTPFLYAVLHNRLSMMEWLVQQGANVFATDRAGLNALMLTTSRSQQEPDLKVLQRLLDWGIDINAIRPNGRTALHMCGLRLHVDAAIFLIERGARFDIQDSSGKTVLDLAREKNKNANQLIALIEKRQLEDNLAISTKGLATPHRL